MIRQTKTDRLIPTAILGNVTRWMYVGWRRVPRVLRTAAGNEYSPSDLDWTDNKRCYGDNRRYTSGEATWATYPNSWLGIVVGWRQAYTRRMYRAAGLVDIHADPPIHHYPFTSRFFLRLRMWMRRARRTVYTRALVGHHLPSLLGKRRR